MQPTYVQCLGVGDGAASAKRNHSAYLYRYGDATLLFDCGPPVSRTLKALGVSAEAIDRIFLSHLHSDHVGGLFMLLQGFWLDQRTRELPVHVPAGAVDLLRQTQLAVFLFDELLKFSLRFAPVQAGQAVGCGAATVTPFRTTHLDEFRKRFQGRYGGDFEAFCFLIEAGGHRLGHSADLGSPADLDPLLAQPLDLLVCELSHFEAEDLFRYLAGRSIKQLVLVHLAQRYWEKQEDVLRLAKRLLPGTTVAIAQEGQRFEL